MIHFRRASVVFFGMRHFYSTPEVIDFKKYKEPMGRDVGSATRIHISISWVSVAARFPVM
jgi:hypothetical protein